MFSVSAKLALAILMMFATSSFAWSQDGEKDSKQKIEFNADLESPCLTYNVIMGHHHMEKEVDPLPRMRVWPSGKVICRHRGVEVESELPKKILMETLEFLVNEKEIYKLSAEGIKKDVEDAGKKIYLKDGLTSDINLDLKNGTHRLKVFASDFTLRMMPGLKSMERAMAIERKMEQTMARALLKNGRNQRTAVKTVNEALRERIKKKLDEFTFEDIKRTDPVKDGKIKITFEQIIENKKKGTKSRLIGRYTRKEDGSESATVIVLGIPK